VVVRAIMMTGLLIWQFSSPPNLERSSRAQRANAQLQQVVKQNDSAQLVESNVRFTRANTQENTLLCVVYVQRQSQATRSAEQIRADLTQAIQSRLLQDFNATPLVDVIVLEAPDTKS